MFKVRLSLQVNDTNPLFFLKGMMQFYSSLNVHICSDTEACNANDRQLTFQYFI